MSISYFQKGASLMIEGCQFEMKRELGNGLWQLETTKTGRIVEHTIEALRSMYANRKLVFFDDRKVPNNRKQIAEFSGQTILVAPQITEAKWNSAKFKRHIILAVLGLPITRKHMELAIKQATSKCSPDFKVPHWTTVSRWKKKYIQGGKNIFCILDKNLLKGNRSRRYPEEVLQIVESVVDAHFLTLEKKTVNEVLVLAINAVKRENELRVDTDKLPIPSRRLIQSSVNNIPAFDRTVAREGRTAAIKKFRVVLHQHVTQRALETAEIDHTLLDLFVIDDKNGLPLGRPWITVCIDTHTRCVLGIYIGFEPPSFLTVSRCLKHAFLPKSNLQEDWPEIKNAWLAHGVMENLVVDNGLEFHSNSLEKLAFAFGINITFSARKTPWYKGKVERFFGTLNREVAHPNPGTTFSNIFEKQEYDPSKHAVITSSRLKLIIHKWIADVYHQRPHRGLEGQSPAKIWESSVHVEDIPIPDDPEQIEAMLGHSVSRVLSHTGILQDGLFYNSPDLASVFRREGEKVEVQVRINEGDLSHIYVQPTKSEFYIRIPALRSDYTSDLTKFQHKIIQRFSDKKYGKKDVDTWMQGKADLQEIIDDSIHSKPKKSRARIARFEEKSSNLIVDTRKSDRTDLLPFKPEPKIKTNEKTKAQTVASSRPSYGPIIEKRT